MGVWVCVEMWLKWMVYRAVYTPAINHRGTCACQASLAGRPTPFVRLLVTCLLQVDEYEELWGGADDAEYRRFLASLRELPELPTFTTEAEDSGEGRREATGALGGQRMGGAVHAVGERGYWVVLGGTGSGADALVSGSFPALPVPTCRRKRLHVSLHYPPSFAW